VAVDARGQMVLPKKVREQAGIRAGDQLALVSWEQDGATWCLFLLKADRLANLVGDMLGPMMKGALGT
jgi:AbrB family looped-hinge helix DNA binding protein